jgi:stage V sporulation protein AE
LLKEKKMEYIQAFWVGGLICALVQILLDKTKLLPGRVMVLLVCTGAFLGSLGIYDRLIDFAGAGASVPLLGFGNTDFWGFLWAVLLPVRWEFRRPLFSDIWPALFLNLR